MSKRGAPKSERDSGDEPDADSLAALVMDWTLDRGVDLGVERVLLEDSLEEWGWSSVEGDEFVDG